VRAENSVDRHDWGLKWNIEHCCGGNQNIPAISPKGPVGKGTDALGGDTVAMLEQRSSRQHTVQSDRCGTQQATVAMLEQRSSRQHTLRIHGSAHVKRHSCNARTEKFKAAHGAERSLRHTAGDRRNARTEKFKAAHVEDPWFGTRLSTQSQC
jgi:hypothetical protein